MTDDPTHRFIQDGYFRRGTMRAPRFIKQQSNLITIIDAASAVVGIESFNFEEACADAGKQADIEAEPANNDDSGA